MEKILVELKNPPCCGDCVFMYFDDFTKCCRHPNAAFNDEYNGVVRLNYYDKED